MLEKCGRHSDAVYNSNGTIEEVMVGSQTDNTEANTQAPKAPKHKTSELRESQLTSHRLAHFPMIWLVER